MAQFNVSAVVKADIQRLILGRRRFMVISKVARVLPFILPVPHNHDVVDHHFQFNNLRHQTHLVCWIFPERPGVLSFLSR